MIFENIEVYKKNDSCKLLIVGIVVIIFLSFNLYKIVVFLVIIFFINFSIFKCYDLSVVIY